MFAFEFEFESGWGRSAQVPYDPVLVWTEQNQCERNGQTWRSQYHGVYVLPTSRTFRDVIGATFKVQFEIVDVRPATGASNTERYF